METVEQVLPQAGFSFLRSLPGDLMRFRDDVIPPAMETHEPGMPFFLEMQQLGLPVRGNGRFTDDMHQPGNSFEGFHPGFQEVK